MKVLVTGGAGFIGSHVVDGLRSQGDEVIVIDSLDPGVYQYPPDYLRADVTYCFADLRYWRPDARFDDVEAIIHLAALGGVSRAVQEFSNLISANVAGTARLVEIAKTWSRLEKIVLASSFSVYGANYMYKCPTCSKVTTGERQPDALAQGQYQVLCPQCGTVAEIMPITEEAAPGPLEGYGASKYMQELCFRGFSACPVHILRFSSVYGQRMRVFDSESTIIARIAGWITNEQPPKLFEDGRQIRDWVYVGDVVEAILALLTGKAAPPIINVCSGVPTTLVEACNLIAEAIKVQCFPEVVGGFRAGDMRHCLGDSTLLSNLIERSPMQLSIGARLAFSRREEGI